MTTDRELLGLAYKAFMSGADLNADKDMQKRWNPLTDDGAALRLAVKLGLFTGADFYHFRSLERFAGQDADEYAATRRAIVRAAANLALEPA